jgi:predicted Rossmann-fold nucleotide-binding protein
MEVLTLVQTKKVKKKVMIILYGRKYWEEILNIDAMVKYKMISRKDLRLFRYADTPEEALGYLRYSLKRLKK